MLPCVFQLSELGELGLIFKEENKHLFVQRFVQYVKELLRMKAAMDYTINAGFWQNIDPSGTSCSLASVVPLSDLQKDWTLLKSMIVFSPNDGMKNLIQKNMAFLQRCQQRVDKLSKRGFWNLLRHCGYYRIIRRHFNDADMSVTFQDLFSAATAHFMKKGWGKAWEFKQIVEEL